jgi:hypothetical protein
MELRGRDEAQRSSCVLNDPLEYTEENAQCGRSRSFSLTQKYYTKVDRVWRELFTLQSGAKDKRHLALEGQAMEATLIDVMVFMNRCSTSRRKNHKFHVDTCFDDSQQ